MVKWNATCPQLGHGLFSRLLHSAQIQSALCAKWWVLIGFVKSSGALQAELSVGYCYKRFWKSSISVAYYHWAWIWHPGMANAPGSSPGRVVRERSGFLSPLGHRAFNVEREVRKRALIILRTATPTRWQTGHYVKHVKNSTLFYRYSGAYFLHAIWWKHCEIWHDTSHVI